MTAAHDAPPADLPLVPPVPSMSEHYLYVLCFRDYSVGIKVGISSHLDVRMRHFVARVGPYDLERCVAVATADRREAYLLEHTIFAFCKHSRYTPPAPLADIDGHTEWLRAEAYPKVRTIITDWGECPPGRTRQVPIVEILGEDGLERKPQATALISREERQRGVWDRKRAKETKRQGVNRANLHGTCKAIEEHLSFLRRVQLWTGQFGRLEGLLLFRSGGSDQPGANGFIPAEFAANLTANRKITVHREVRWPVSWTLTRKYKIITPRASGRYGLLVHVRIERPMLDARFNRQTPELAAFVRWLELLRAGDYAGLRGVTGDLT